MGLGSCVLEWVNKARTITRTSEKLSSQLFYARWFSGYYWFMSWSAEENFELDDATM